MRTIQRKGGKLFDDNSSDSNDENHFPYAMTTSINDDTEGIEDLVGEEDVLQTSGSDLEILNYQSEDDLYMQSDFEDNHLGTDCEYVGCRDELDHNDESVDEFDQLVADTNTEDTGNINEDTSSANSSI